MYPYVLPTASPSSLIYLFIRIQLRPNLLNLLPLLLGCLAILPRPLKPLCSQTHGNVVFRLGTISSDFPEESACVAFF